MAYTCSTHTATPHGVYWWFQQPQHWVRIQSKRQSRWPVFPVGKKNNFHLLYDPKQNGTFHSARWKKDYSPDLCFVTCEDEHQPLRTTRIIEPHFPNSQHRPSIIITSVPKPRWNFRKANWREFTKSIAESINRISPRSENYQRFCKLVITKAKQYIPRGVRKSYIPCWTNESEALFTKYKESGDPDTGKKLLTSLKEGRWSEEMAALDFTHSSRRAWNLLRKLGGATHSKRQRPKVTANEVEHRLILNGSVKKDRKQAKHILKQQREALSDCPVTSNLSQVFTTDEIINALKATKAGKAAGPDGIFSDMLKNIGPAAFRGCRLSTMMWWQQQRFQKIWRSANVIAIRKPGKPIDEPTSYRPISLLCCCYKLLECFLLTIFESVIPPDSAALAYMAEVAYAAGPALQGPRALGQNKKMCAA